MDVQQVEAKLSDSSCVVIKNAEIPSNNFKIVYKADTKSQQINEINTIYFLECSLVAFPHSQILLDLAKNLTRLDLFACKLTKITQKDLRGLRSLKELYMGENAIEKLPYGLFEFTPNLEVVSFWNNKINEIYPNILDPLRNLRFFSLIGNEVISVKYDSIYNEWGNVTLAQLKDEIKKCSPIEKIVAGMQNEMEALKIKISYVEKENTAIKIENNELNVKFDHLETEFKKLKEMKEKKIICDFTISVNGRDFQTNKEILAVNSPVLKQLIDENLDADHLELKDISEETFKEILSFMYTKIPPNNAANLIELFAASSRLGMEELMDVTAGILMDKVTPYNAPDILYLCKKYGHEELRLKAFEELKKTFPDKL